MRDLSAYRLNSWSEILTIRDKDPERFDRFTNKAYKIFLDLKPGESFCAARVDESSHEVFVKVGCMAIMEGLNLVFSEDFTVIRKLAPIEPRKIKIKAEGDEEGE